MDAHSELVSLFNSTIKVDVCQTRSFFVVVVLVITAPQVVRNKIKLFVLYNLSIVSSIMVIVKV